MTFKIPPPTPQHAKVTFPTPHVLQVTLSRPKDLNCINTAGHLELHALWEWMDEEPSIRVGVLTGEGRAFCAGADLKEWNNQVNSAEGSKRQQPSSGFGGLSRRSGKKPIICAVNGICLGGGCEMIVNADMVIACEKAFFGFPEVQRGVVAIAGALPRVVRTIGRQRAMEMVLTGRRVTAVEAEKWGFVNEVLPTPEEVVTRALEIAGQIAANSPDAVIVSREGVKLGWEGVGAEEGSRWLIDGWQKRLNEGENIKEGLRAFVEKRQPKWADRARIVDLTEANYIKTK
ncbi:ClpP/crotonase-like domain-containing protein [Aspergillus sergii]|uniref:ClpP/crotonase-like domain-containing protein n=1 Tax=Aspergillus sergii TaxID=1034303 RepID=A0A5N6X758_9EURO|nr:ClpP/crotonase-like domain-containing protein [Aspergillus sergii]